MGLYASADLIWGIPVVAYDDDGEPTPFWDEEREDWREFEGELQVRGYGHYDNPDGQHGILTTTRIESYDGDCWEPTMVDDAYDVARWNDKAISKSEDQARAAGLDVSFYGDAGWWLVASYG